MTDSHPAATSRPEPGGPAAGVGRQYLLPTYARADLTLIRGEGCWITAADGRRFLDFAAGIAVVGLGHCHPEPRQAAHAQLDRIWHASNLYWTEPMLRLAAHLSQRFGGAQAFFCNSGAEAIEAAIKYARKATGRPGIVAIEGSFHGRTMGALSVTGQPAKHDGFRPVLDGVSFARLNDAESLRSAVIEAAAGLILIEPILGEGGVRPAQPEFLEAAAKVAAESGALLCFDEIQTGVGRTGSFFAFEGAGVRPALVTLAKGLGNGLPVACLLVADDHRGGFVAGDHASTFGGNPVACAAAIAVCEHLTAEVLATVRATGAYLGDGLRRLAGTTDVRGAGLLLACDVERAAGEVVAACLEGGLLITAAGDKTLRFTPPLIVSSGEVDHALGILAEVLA